MSSTDREECSYELIYWPGVPGRAEHIRLAFEEAGVRYTDTAQAPAGIDVVLGHINATNLGSEANPPPFAPPVLRCSGSGCGTVVISQTANILLYLGPRLGLGPSPDTGCAAFHVNQLAMTALDGLSNETHDTHHPIAINKYYEEQQEAAKERAADYRATRLPKFLAYFERVLKGAASGSPTTPWLHGGALTYADLVLFQCIDGNKHSFPKAMARLQKSNQYSRVFALYDAVRERPGIKKYLASERRQEYGDGIYRRYPELDDQ